MEKNIMKNEVVSDTNQKSEKKKKAEMFIAKVMPWVFCAMVVCIQLTGNIVLADATELMETVLKWIAYLGCFLGVVYFVVGCLHYAAAHSEGDGPAKQKAQGQIAASIMIFAISALITTQASEIIGMIEEPS